MPNVAKTTFRPTAADQALLRKLQKVHGLGTNDVLRLGLRAADREFEAGQFAAAQFRKQQMAPPDSAARDNRK